MLELNVINSIVFVLYIIILNIKKLHYNVPFIWCSIYVSSTSSNIPFLNRRIGFINYKGGNLIHERSRYKRYNANDIKKAQLSDIDIWKNDLSDIPGPWKVFFPHQLSYADGFYPNSDIRPTLLFCDISGRVCGPEHPESPFGAFMLDSKIQEIKDENNYIHSRKCVMVLLSSKLYSNLRLVLLGRVFYSKDYVVNELLGAVRMRSAIFIGQSFLESYDNQYALEALNRFKRKVTMLDKQGNEIDPINWKSQPLESIGSPFRWLHGTDKWKLLGPFVAYRSLGGKGSIDHKFHIFEKYEDDVLYNIVDPFEINCTNYTSADKLETEVNNVLSSVFKRNDKLTSNINLYDEEYLSAFKDEMIKLGMEGPEFYKETME